MTRRDIILKWIAYLVALAVITIINTNVLSRLPIAIPLLLPVTAVAVGILEGPKFGAAFGMVTGLVMTSVGHRSLLLVPVLAVIAWVCGLLTEHALRRDGVGHILSALCIVTLWEVYQVLSRSLTHVAELNLLVGIAAGEWLWTVVLAMPVYWVCHFCCVRYGRIYHE